MKEIYEQRIAIIGAGNIGRMLLERLRRNGMTMRMAVYDRDSQKAQMVRVMPNMPSLVGQEMNPVCFSEKVPPKARENAMQLLEVLGETVEVSEEQMNWCAGLSGAAMRSLIPVIEGMIQAGLEAGLSTKKARKIAAQMMRGTADLVAQLDETSLEDIKTLTPMETVDEGQVARIFKVAAAGAKAKIDWLQSVILSEN
jgi:pyrroline-5-carboxylate reductase